MNANQLNIDDFVNYEAEYKSVIKNAKITGDRIIGRCPFHNDNKDSFTADLKTGMCHCFTGCIDGNFVSFWAKYYGTSTKEAYKQILDKYGKLEEPEKKEKPVTLAVDYVAECEKSLSKQLGRGVKIVNGKRKGKFELEFYGQDDLQTLLDALMQIKK